MDTPDATAMDLKAIYGHGQCASLAMAVLEHLQLPCVVFYRDGDPDDDSAVHVANQLGDAYLDIYGLVTKSDLEARYGCALSEALDPAGEDVATQFEVCMGEWSDGDGDPFGARRAWRDCGAIMKSHLELASSSAAAPRQRIKP